MQKRSKPLHANRQKLGSAFTFLELLAVVVVVAILASMLASGLATTRTNSFSFQCMNNLRQLGAAWTMYADDNEGRVVSYGRGTRTGLTVSNECWVAGWLDFTS